MFALNLILPFLKLKSRESAYRYILASIQVVTFALDHELDSPEYVAGPKTWTLITANLKCIYSTRTTGNTKEDALYMYILMILSF